MEMKILLKLLTFFLVLHEGEFSSKLSSGEKIMQYLEVKEPIMRANLGKAEVESDTIHLLMNKYICHQVVNFEDSYISVMKPMCESCYKNIFSLEGLKNPTEFLEIYINCTEQYPPHYYNFIAKQASEALENSTLKQKCLMDVTNKAPELVNNNDGTIDVYIIFLTLLFSFNWFMRLEYSPQHIIFMQEIQTNLANYSTCLANLMKESEKQVVIETKEKSEEAKMRLEVQTLNINPANPDYYASILCLDATSTVNKGCLHCYRGAFPGFKTRNVTITADMIEKMHDCRQDHDPYVLAYAKIKMRKYFKPTFAKLSARACEAKILNTTRSFITFKFPDNQYDAFVFSTTLLEIEYVTDWFAVEEPNSQHENHAFTLDVMCI